LIICLRLESLEVTPWLESNASASNFSSAVATSDAESSRKGGQHILLIDGIWIRDVRPTATPA
jgi:hypothetical protein